MGNVSTFGTFTMARLGIYASQKAIDIVGNNISNINTEGYTRQFIDQFSLNMGGSDRYQSAMDTRVGSGAFVQGVTQLRDQYLDIRYRDEQASVGAMQARRDGLKQLEDILDEVGRGDDEAGVLEARFNEMIEQMNDLVTQGAGKDEFDSLFRAAASSVVNTLHSYASQLENLAKNQETHLRQDIDGVNTILERIRNLDASIRKTQVYGGNALEQQDERNKLIDELSEYTRINVTYEKEYLGEKKYVDKLVIKTADEPQRTLVDGIFATKLSIRQVQQKDDSGNPVLDEEGNPVMIDDPDFNFELAPLRDVHDRELELSVRDTTLKTVDLTDPSQVARPTKLFSAYPQNGTDAGGNPVTYRYQLKAGGDGKYILDEDGNYTVEQYEVAEDSTETLLDGVYKTLTPEEVVFAEGTGVATPENNLDGSGRSTDPDGREISYTYSLSQNEDGTYDVKRREAFSGGVQLKDTELYGKLQSEREILIKQGVFSTAEELAADPNAAAKRGIPFYRKALDVLANTLAGELNAANVAEGALFSNDGTTDDTEGITASNISISTSWANGSFKVYTSSDRDSRSTAADNLQKIYNILTGSHEYKPTIDGAAYDGAASDLVFFTGSFQELFTNHMAGSLAMDVNTTQTMLGNYETTADEIYVDRDAVMGVDLNDEAMNMMMYQKSFSAACRLMTTFNEMLEKLINGT